MNGSCQSRKNLLIATAAAAVALLTPQAQAQAQQTAAHAISIESQDLDDALRALARQTSTQIVFEPGAVRGRTAPSVSGAVTTEQALRQLLADTGLTYRSTAPGTFTILAQATEVRPTQTDVPSQQASVEQEIIVTAQKREQNLQDVPLSVAVIGNEELERRGAIGMEDYLRSVPGVNQIDDGSISNAVVIRGVTTSPEFENYGAGTTVGTYFGETSITGAAGVGAGGIDVRPVDIARIEVLRGPQGTTYGASSIGGTLRIIPNAPNLQSIEGNVSVAASETGGYGGENTMLQGTLNLPIVTDRLAVRAVVYEYDDSGFYRNIGGVDQATIDMADAYGLADFVTGPVRNDIGHMNTVGGRLAVLWRPTDRLDISANYLTQTIEQDGAPESGSGPYEQARMPIAESGRVRGAGEVSDTDIDLTNLTLTYDLSWASLTATASHIDSGSAYARDQSVFYAAPVSDTIWSDYQADTFEARISTNLNGPLQVLAGFYYEDVAENFLEENTFPDAGSPGPFGTNPLFVSERERNLQQRAYFGELTYHLTDALSVTLGGRHFEYDKDEHVLQEGDFVGVPIGTGTRENLTNSEQGETYRANVSYEPNDDVLLYASWSQGFRLGRPQSVALIASNCDISPADGLFDDGSGLTVDSLRNIRSDTLESTELGGKFQFFQRRLTLNASAFHIDWSDLPILATSVCGGNPNYYTANVGSATSDGFEFQASIAATDGLRIDFGAGYTNAELASDAPALGGEDGDRLPGSPRWNANLGVQYDFRLMGNAAFVRGDLMYAGEFFGNFAEDPVTRAGDYIKIDARGGITLNQVDLELFVRNLTDEDAYTWRTSYAREPFFGYQLRPRTIGVQARYSF